MILIYRLCIILYFFKVRKYRYFSLNLKEECAIGVE